MKENENVNGSASRDGVLLADAPERGVSAWKLLALGLGATIGAVAAANALIAQRTGPAKLELEGVFARYPARYGDLAYTVSGSGSPVLLLHDPSIGGSMAEWDNNFEALARRHTVYAFDFLGWGLSDKPAHQYGADDFVEQIQYFVEDVIGEPCAVIASGRAGLFAVEAARRAPEWFTRLALICPTAVTDDEIHAARKLLRPLLEAPIAGSAALNWLTSRSRIAQRLSSAVFHDKGRVDEALITRLYTAAHQPGAQYGLAALLTGAMDLDWREPWSQLQKPALLIWGRNTLKNGLETAPEWLALAPEARLEVIDQAMLRPHIEQADAWNRLMLDWLKA
jgi:pimeloyl-ACP methyl ester carboxylesterase